MILSGSEILNQLEQGAITIDPFDPSRINPASVDLTLGDEVAVYDRYATVEPTNGGPHVSDGSKIQYYRSSPPLDSKTKAPIRRYKIDPELGWVLNPGVGYLMHTAERISTHCFVPILDGKSSIGRLFIQVHVTAGFGDPGFSGQYTLEVSSMFPVRVYPGMRICQMRFHRMEGEVVSYQKSGSYTGELATGPVESQAFRSAFR